MKFTRSMEGNSPAMFGRWVRFIFLPSILREIFCGPGNKFVTMSLCENGCGGNVTELGVTLNNGVPFDSGAPGGEAVSINNDHFRSDIKGIQGSVHRQNRGAENIDFINFSGRARGDGPADGFALNDFAHFIAPAFGQGLGIIQIRMRKVRRENDGSGKDGSGQTTATGFVTSGFNEISLEGRREEIHRRIP